MMRMVLITIIIIIIIIIIIGTRHRNTDLWNTHTPNREYK